MLTFGPRGPRDPISPCKVITRQMLPILSQARDIKSRYSMFYDDLPSVHPFPLFLECLVRPFFPESQRKRKLTEVSKYSQTENF